MKYMSFICIVFFLAMFGCSKDSTPASPSPPVEKDNLALGWQSFEAQRYDSAITYFTTAYNAATTAALRGESLNGRGWSYMYKRDLVKSKGDFVFALGLSGISSTSLNDVRVGSAFALYSLNDFSGAALNANAALADYPAYVFGHDPKVTVKRIRLLIVQCYFANGQFAQSAAQLDIVDPIKAPHSADPTILLGNITSALNSL
jgi:hypothetical protein